MPKLILIVFLCICQTFSLEKGPAGWDVYRQLDRMPELYSGVRTRQFSSFDRTGGNDDGNGHSCLRWTKQNQCVIAEWSGPGEVASIWFTRDAGIVHATGRIIIELDGDKIISHHLQDVVNGKLGYPFVWPMVGNAEDTQGGVVIKVPMPFTKSMKIVVDKNPNYYHVTFRTFSSSDGIKTFNLTESAIDVVEQNQKFGIANPRSDSQSSSHKIKNFDIAANESKSILTLKESGKIESIRLQLLQVKRSPRVVDDGRAFGADGYSTFFVKIDPNNQGVRITRRYDPSVLHQKALLSVNGIGIGDWNNKLISDQEFWAEVSISIIANISRGQHYLHVRNDFISSERDFNEFRYDIECKIDDEWVRTDVVDVGADHPGEEKAHYYDIWNQTWADIETFNYQVDKKDIDESDKILENTFLQIRFDDQLTVNAPVGEFFGSGLGMVDNRALFFAIDATTGWFSCWWPMPFGYQVDIKLINRNSFGLKNVNVEVKLQKSEEIRQKLVSKKIGYFHATHRREQTVNGRDYIFLRAEGHGVVYGVTHTMKGLVKDPASERVYLEGDERIYIDGSSSPSLYGTGTEDFYESGWYFRGGRTFHMPLSGNPGHRIRTAGCLYDCTAAIRLLVPDAIHFTSSLIFGIEHGPANDVPAIYSSVTYWYGQSSSLLKMTDVVEVTDETSRKSHDYSAVGERTYNLTSVFEGQDDKVKVTMPVTSSSGQIKLGVSIAADNDGVIIRRTSDQLVSHQCVRVTVDGQSIGLWLQPLGNRWQRWLMDDFDVPAAVTRNKSRLSVLLEPVSYDGQRQIWSAARYQALTIVK